MPESLIGLVEDVRIRNLKDDRQLYVIRISGKEVTTFKRDLAAAAKSMLNQQVNAQITTKQNGEWTNHYLEGIESVAAKQDFKVDDKQADIRKAVALKAAIEMLQYFPESGRHWNNVKAMCPDIKRYLESDWDEVPAPDPVPAGQADVEDLPF